MIVERSTHPQFISNTYLVADGVGGPAFIIDAGGPVEPIFEAAERNGLEPTHLLLTHHHYDHVSETPALRERWPAITVMASDAERSLLDASTYGEIEPLEAGDALTFGELAVRALHTPGHTAGMLSLVVTGQGESRVFTGDTLFRGSVGGVRAPGHTTYADLRDAIMGTLMALPAQTVIEPGHAEPTTVAREWEENPFIRVWRGIDAEGHTPCTALGEPATLILLGPDYDGGTKAWVRWPDGSDDIVPGSQVS